MSRIVNAISVDVEEYFHATNLEPYFPRSRWNELPSRVVESTEQVLEIFSKTNTRGTFFTLGFVAERYPEIVKQIVAAGHELASHGYHHYLAYTQSPEEFRQDVECAKKLLEDTGGVPVRGYRAPNFSITEKNPWAHQILVEAGYRYDSSVYPVWHPRYANLEKSRYADKVETPRGSLLIAPLACYPLRALKREYRLPIAGGAYWRHFPAWLLKGAIGKMIRTEAQGSTYYFHPWELDIKQPKATGAPFVTRLRHYGGTAGFAKRVENFTSSFSFGTVWSLLEKIFPEETATDSSVTQR